MQLNDLSGFVEPLALSTTIPAGIYYVQIKTSSQVLYKKFVRAYVVVTSA